MKLHASLCLLLIAGCATVAPAARTARDVAAPGPTEQAPGEPVKLRTSAGSFLVRPGNAEDLARALSGQPTQHSYFADVAR